MLFTANEEAVTVLEKFLNFIPSDLEGIDIEEGVKEEEREVEGEEMISREILEIDVVPERNSNKIGGNVMLKIEGLGGRDGEEKVGGESVSKEKDGILSGASDDDSGGSDDSEEDLALYLAQVLNPNSNQKQNPNTNSTPNPNPNPSPDSN
jgi:hypothetical protein